MEKLNYEYRRATISDLPAIMRIFQVAQAFMEANGNPQWEKGFPDETDVKGGIYGGILYCVTCLEEIVAVFSTANYDGDYDEIDGAWLTNKNYLSIHRVAVCEEFRGKGAAKFIVGCAAEELAHRCGRTSLRFDTHEKNIPMRSLLNKLGFTHCGTIRLSRDGTSRLAFEKVLQIV